MMRKALSANGLMIFVALGVLFGLMIVGFTVRGDIADAPDAEYTWTAPEYGTPVDHYVAQVLVNDVDILVMGPLLSGYARVEVVYGNKYRIRVAGVDAAGNQGPYSGWSVPYTPELAPPEF